MNLDTQYIPHTDDLWRKDRIETVGETDYLRDTRGALVPRDAIKAEDQLLDEMVHKLIHYARQLSAQIDRFKGHSFEDVADFQDLLVEKYGAKRKGGRKGNVTFTSFDGCQKVVVQVADQIEFGPELEAAKLLVDECVREWSEGSRSELKVLVERAFQVDKEGKINRAELFSLARVDIDDDRWRQAMAALKDSIRVIGSRTYMRFYERDTPDGNWRAITIDLASAKGGA